MKIKDKIRETVSKEGDVYPICFPWFTVSMAIIYVNVITNYMSSCKPRKTTMGDSVYEQVPKDHYNEAEIIEALRGRDLITHVWFYRLVSGFLEWFVEQEVPELPFGDDDDLEEDEDDKDWAAWFGIEFIAEKWNEYAEMKRK